MLNRRDLWLIPALVVLAHVAVLNGYGWFRDEFYYLACAAHLDFGYVDHPSLSILPLWLVKATVGDSLIALRLLAALAMGGATWAIGRLTMELGGGAFARILAMTSAAIAPVALALGSYYSMNALDMLVWALGSWAFVRAIGCDTTRDWALLGLVIGLGIENKISALWLLGGLGAGIIVTEPRRLVTRGPWVAGAIAAALSLPYLVWQIQHGWPTLEFMRNAAGGKMAVQSARSFIAAQILNMHPIALPMWLAGLVALIARPTHRASRMLGVMFIAVLVLLIANATSRASYLAPAYAPLLAAGACWWEPRIVHRARWVRTAAIAVIVALGAVTAPLAMPVLSADAYLKYASALGQSPATEEKKALSDMPQFFADRFGWQEWARGVAAVYQSLSPDDQRTATIYASNYGEAGAIDVLGPPLGLPPARSGHNNYWYWGPGPANGGPVIALLPLESRRSLEQRFESVELAGTIGCVHCMPYENHRPIFVCRRPRQTLADVWARVKHFD